MLGIDDAIANVVMGRLWSLLAGPLSIVLITTRLSPAGQGFYYTFSSILALKILLELGLIYVLMQFAAHEMAGLHWSGGVVTGDPVKKSRLASLVRLSVRWYSAASLLVVLVVLPVGIYLFSRDPESQRIEWKIPWVMLVVACSASVAVSPFPAIIEGCGKVAEVTRVRLFEGMAVAIGLWAGLLAGLQLYSVVLASLAGLAMTCGWLFRSKIAFFRDLLSQGDGDSGESVDWKREILPLQWRTAVTWISGYFAYQFFTPAVFAAKGADAAGKVGVTLNLLSVIGAVSLSWMQTKTAPFGALVANRDFETLDHRYRVTFWQSTFIYAFGCFGLLAVLWLAGWYGHPFALRFAPFPVMIVFMIAVGLNHSVFNRSIYLRAYKSEPFYALHLVNGILVGAMLYTLAKRVELFDLSLIYCLGSSVPVALITVFIFRRLRRVAQAA